MERMTYIYALRDPRDGRVYYTGKSFNPLVRLKNHIAQIKAARGYNINFSKWLESLISFGFYPMLQFVEKCHESEWKQKEQFWISEYRRLGHPLLNVSTGGFGKPMGISHPCPEWWKVEFGNRHRGKKKTEEQKRKIRDSNIKTWSNPELREALGRRISEASLRRAPEVRSAHSRNAILSVPKSKRIEMGRRAVLSQTPEVRIENSRKGAKAFWSKFSPEERSRMMIERLKRGWITRRRRSSVSSL